MAKAGCVALAIVGLFALSLCHKAPDTAAPVAATDIAAEPLAAWAPEPSPFVSTPRHAGTTTRARRGHRVHHSRAGARFYDGGGSCPCGSGHICIGPRGGRYCMTSGGHKEYGQ